MASIINSQEEFDELMTKLNNLTVIDNLETEDADNPLSAKQGKVLKTLIDTIALTIYPVGSIYMSVENTEPSVLFGGEWVAWGAGRVPVGVDTTQTEFNEVEKAGGEKSHTLTTSEMPAHTHTIYGRIDRFQGSGTAIREATQQANNTSPVDTSSVGNSQPHNNLQPYITCYMWKRIA